MGSGFGCLEQEPLAASSALREFEDMTSTSQVGANPEDGVEDVNRTVWRIETDGINGF